MLIPCAKESMRLYPLSGIPRQPILKRSEICKRPRSRGEWAATAATASSSDRPWNRRAHELEELTMIYVNRGLCHDTARQVMHSSLIRIRKRGSDPDGCTQVAEQLTEKDVIRSHARDELGIDLDDMSNPLQAGHRCGCFRNVMKK